jgi:hypothetical protein
LQSGQEMVRCGFAASPFRNIMAWGPRQAIRISSRPELLEKWRKRACRWTAIKGERGCMLPDGPAGARRVPRNRPALPLPTPEPLMKSRFLPETPNKCEGRCGSIGSDLLIRHKTAPTFEALTGRPSRTLRRRPEPSGLAADLGPEAAGSSLLPSRSASLVIDSLGSAPEDL